MKTLTTLILSEGGLQTIAFDSLATGKLPQIAPDIVWQMGGFSVTETMLSGAITVGILILFALILRMLFVPKWQSNIRRLGAVQVFVEGLVDGVQSNTESMVLSHTMGRHRYISFWFFAVVCYVFLGTMVELLSLRPPTSTLSMTIAFALCTFVFIHGLGVYEAHRHKRLSKRALHYLNPIAVITDSIVPMSMAMRLFISVFSGYLIMYLIYSIPFPIGYPALGNIVFTLFHAVIQSYIFFVLSTSFISEAIE